MTMGSLDKRGKFIVIDGMDGSGKGTQIKLLQERLSGKDVLFTREPGGSPFGEEIREILLRKEGNPSNPIADFFLFFASRGSHVEDKVHMARERGTHVISDRYDSSTYAFQIWGEERQELDALFQAVRSNLMPDRYHPDLYIFLELPARVAYERRKNDAMQHKDRFDIQPLAYHERVREGFNSFAERYGPAKLIDAQRAPGEVFTDLWEVVSHELGV